MLSLPYIVPRDDLWSPTSFRPNITSSAADGSNHHQHAAHHHHHHHHHAHSHGHPHHHHHPNATTAHAHGPAHAHAVAPISFRSLTHTHARYATIDQLTLEERAIEERKLNVRRFGAGWLRPPGVPKTFQARLDEEQERREQAEIVRREAQMAELAAASAAAANANANANANATGLTVDGAEGGQEQVEPGVVANGVGDGDGDEGMEERDLDADVPDADAMQSGSDSDDHDDDEEEDEEEDGEDGGSEDTTDDMTDANTNIINAQDGLTEIDVDEAEGNITIEPSRFLSGEESILEASLVGGDAFSPARAERFVDAEDAELDGRAQDMRDLGVEPNLDELDGGVVDLDADIPEAGSYEHTDTEEEDSSDSDVDEEDESKMEVNENSFVNAPSSASRNADRSALDDTVEDMLDSSFVSLPPRSAGPHQHNSLHNMHNNIRTNVREARRNRRSMATGQAAAVAAAAVRGGAGGGGDGERRAARGRWSGGSDVAMTNSDFEPSPASTPASMARSAASTNGSSSMMARLRAARRNG